MRLVRSLPWLCLGWMFVQPVAAAPSLAVGVVHGCAVKDSGAAVCWGWNVTGQLGNGTVSSDPFNQSILSPVPVTSPGANIASITAGAQHTCAVTAGGAAYCWGFNLFGQLGRGFGVDSRRDSALPVLVDTFSSGVASISAGGLHTCAVTTGGGAYCWGYAGFGQVGAGFFGSVDNSSLPVSPYPVQGLSSGVAAISAGGLHTCALTVAGGVLCWGANSRGQLGDGTTIDQPGPVQVVGLTSGVVAIAAGGSHTCAVMASGAVRCWGSDASGELGDGVDGYDGGRYSPVPVSVVGLPAPVRSITAGGAQPGDGEHTCVVTSGGAALCWGSNFFGQLGNGGETGLHAFRPVPTPVSFLGTGVASIAAGLSDTCALTVSGAVLCWGWNEYGELGDGTFLQRSRPVPVLRELAGGSIASNDWFLGLRTGATIPGQRIPPFLLVASGRVTADDPAAKADAPVSITVDAQFRSSDAGHPIYVFAYAPSNLAKRTKDSGDTCVLSQLTPGGELQQASAASLQPYVSGVTGAQHQAVTIVGNVLGSRLAGATFCVGTATTAAQAATTANSRCVATLPSTGKVCIAPEEETADTTANTPSALSGLWWNAAESGWGIHFTQRSNVVFAAWYTYDMSGNPKWLVSTCNMPAGTTGTAGRCNGTIFEVNGPTFFGTTFNPALVNAVSAGTLQVDFQNADSASMTYTAVAGQTRTVPITRQPLANGTTPPAVNYTDIWWNPNESGWGMAVAQQFATMFLAWYVYDGAGKPIWYVATCAMSGTTCAGDLLRTTGPAFGPTFDPSSVRVFTAGTLSVNFTDGNNATLDYTVDGTSASKTITRQLF
jgi:alpha-tubulin suppressor-like RCC1 family protein